MIKKIKHFMIFTIVILLSLIWDSKKVKILCYFEAIALFMKMEATIYKCVCVCGK